MTLTVTTPDAAQTASVDAVSFTVPDGEGKTARGGSVGIRPGHTDALMAVAAGDVVGRMRGEEVLRIKVAAGFAVVRAHAVTVITDRVN